MPVGEFNIPLIGIKPLAAKEKCDKCKFWFPLQQIEIMLDGKKFLCTGCKAKHRK